MADQERQEDKALRDQPHFIAIHAMYRIPRDFDNDAWEKTFQGICTLFGCLGDAETCPNEHYATFIGDQAACHRDLFEDPDLEAALADLSSLRSAVAHLADDFDGDAEHYERIVADHNRSLWVRDEAGARAMAKRDSARRLRSLLPQEGTNEEGAD